MSRAMALTAVCCIAMAGTAAAGEGRIRFSKDPASAMARAKQERKPAAFYFTADW